MTCLSKNFLFLSQFLSEFMVQYRSIRTFVMRTANWCHLLYLISTTLIQKPKASNFVSNLHMINSWIISKFVTYANKSVFNVVLGK